MESFQFKREYLPVMIAVVIIGVVIITYYFGVYRPGMVHTGNTKTVSDSDKMKILEELEAHGASSTPGQGIKTKILNNLSGSKSDGQYDYSTEGKLQILESLQKNQSSQ